MDPVEMLRALMGPRGQRALARKMHISDVYLSDVMRRIKPPGPKILRYLGLERVESVTYRQKPPRQKKQRTEAEPTTEATPMS